MTFCCGPILVNIIISVTTSEPTQCVPRLPWGRSSRDSWQRKAFAGTFPLHPGARYQKVPTQTSVASVKIGSLTLYTFQCGWDVKTERHKLFSPKANSWDINYRIHRFANLFTTLFPKCDVTKNWNLKNQQRKTSVSVCSLNLPLQSPYDVIWVKCRFSICLDAGVSTFFCRISWSYQSIINSKDKTNYDPIKVKLLADLRYFQYIFVDNFEIIWPWASNIKNTFLGGAYSKHNHILIQIHDSLFTSCHPPILYFILFNHLKHINAMVFQYWSFVWGAFKEIAELAGW